MKLKAYFLLILVGIFQLGGEEAKLFCVSYALPDSLVIIVHKRRKKLNCGGIHIIGYKLRYVIREFRNQSVISAAGYLLGNLAEAVSAVFVWVKGRKSVKSTLRLLGNIPRGIAYPLDVFYKAVYTFSREMLLHQSAYLAAPILINCR